MQLKQKAPKGAFCFLIWVRCHVNSKGHELSDFNRTYPIWCFVVGLVGAIVYFPALSGGFVLDDGINILQNRLLYVGSLSWESLVYAALSFHDGNGGRPLPMLSFALDYWRAGSMDPGVFKTTNLIIHGLTTFFMALFLRRLLRVAGLEPKHAAPGALIIALVWAIHPLQVSSVMYVVQRMQTMETLFLVLALWSYLAMRQVQIDGTSRGRGYGVLVLLFWGLALGCKEDAPILFVFLLIIELTMLRFQAAQPDISKGLKQSYLLLTAAGGVVYFFIVIPYYWSWDAYAGRDFSSPERLLTQARVLVMYLGQILYPNPNNMPFIYDQMPVSRSILRPWTTLVSLVIIVFLLAWAWCWRKRRPLFSFGVLFFFAGHFITSNVIALELVFEHRNYLPLVGALLAVVDLLRMVWERWRISKHAMAYGLGIVLLILAGTTLAHAYTWGDPVRHGEKLVELLPGSPRAWTQLGGAHFDLYKETGDPVHLSRAVAANERGLERIRSVSMASNVIIYKSLLGTVTDSDWERFLEVLDEAPRGWQNKFAVWTLMNNVDRGFDIDPRRVIEAIEMLPAKAGLHDNEILRMAVFIYKNGDKNRSLPYFIKFAERAKQDDPTLVRIINELEDAGHKEWVEVIRDAQIRKSLGRS